MMVACSDVTSEDSAITFNIYDRAVSDLGFLGTVQVKPVLVNDYTVDQWYKCVAYPLPSRNVKIGRAHV